MHVAGIRPPRQCKPIRAQIDLVRAGTWMVTARTTQVRIGWRYSHSQPPFGGSTRAAAQRQIHGHNFGSGAASTAARQVAGAGALLARDAVGLTGFVGMINTPFFLVLAAAEVIRVRHLLSLHFADVLEAPARTRCLTARPATPNHFGPKRTAQNLEVVFAEPLSITAQMARMAAVS